MKLSNAALKAADELMPIDLAEKPDPAIHRRQRDAMARVIQAAIDEETRALRSRLERADRVIAEVGVMAHDFDQLGPADDHRFEKIVETIREFAG